MAQSGGPLQCENLEAIDTKRTCRDGLLVVRFGSLARESADASTPSASNVVHHHVVGEPQAGKNQYAGENESKSINDHSMPVLIVAFWAFVFCEIRDRRIVRRLPPVSPRRGPHSRPERYHTANFVV
jgi:hypothetical protein